MRRSKSRSDVRFVVWEGVATHPHFTQFPGDLQVYLQLVGRLALYKKPLTESIIGLLFRGKELRAAHRLAAAGAIGGIAGVGDGELSINHTFGISGRRLFWLQDEKIKKQKRRKAVDVSLRFRVLRRDGFRCVYCGAMPGSALLHVDHVMPVSKGGGSHPQNLVTACQDCNLGKSDTELTEPLQ